MAHLKQLMAVLQNPPKHPAAQATPFGQLSPPLGFERYNAVRVVAALLRTEDPTAAAGSFLPAPTLPRAQDLQEAR